MTHVRSTHNSFIVLLAVLTAVTPQPLNGAPQGALIDRAILVVRQGQDIVGREEFTLHRGQASETGSGYFGPGYTASVTAYYPPSRSYATARSVVRFDADSQPSSARMDLAGGGQPNVFVDFAGRRITVRNRTAAGESAGQYPRTDRMLVVDDALVSTFAAFPDVTVGPVALFYPRSGRRVRATLEDHGTESTVVDGIQHRLRHWTLGSGEHIKHLWFDGRGRLVKLECPSVNLTAIRSPGGR